MIIGVTGASGSGKTVVTKHLRKRHGFQRIHAGKPVKDAMRAGWPQLTKDDVGGDQRIDEPHAAFGGVAPRTVSDAVSNAVHETAPRATALALGKRLDKLAGKDVAVDGVRSPHEAAAIRRRGGVVVRVTRGNGKADPQLQMDQLAATIEPDHELRRPAAKGKDGKDKLRADVDQIVNAAMANAEP
jgi:hypothetical protein